MDNLITKTDFKGLIALAGMSQGYNSSSLDEYITLYQEKILKLLLGESLYNLLDDNYTQGNSDKWDKLVNGDSYVLDRNGKDFTIEYKGVKDMLAFFVYYYYKSELARQSTTTGETVSQNQNSKVSGLDTKIIKSYNFGIDLYGETKNYEDVEYVHVGDFPFFLTNTPTDIYKATSFNYITYQNGLDEDTYPNWIFTALTKINEFGI